MLVIPLMAPAIIADFLECITTGLKIVAVLFTKSETQSMMEEKQFFFSNAPHLLKTGRNSLLHSKECGSRYMRKQNEPGEAEHILWGAYKRFVSQPLQSWPINLEEKVKTFLHNTDCWESP